MASLRTSWRSRQSPSVVSRTRLPSRRSRLGASPSRLGSRRSRWRSCRSSMESHRTWLVPVRSPSDATGSLLAAAGYRLRTRRRPVAAGRRRLSSTGCFGRAIRCSKPSIRSPSVPAGSSRWLSLTPACGGGVVRSAVRLALGPAGPRCLATRPLLLVQSSDRPILRGTFFGFS